MKQNTAIKHATNTLAAAANEAINQGADLKVVKPFDEALDDVMHTNLDDLPSVETLTKKTRQKKTPEQREALKAKREDKRNEKLQPMIDAAIAERLESSHVIPTEYKINEEKRQPIIEKTREFVKFLFDNGMTDSNNNASFVIRAIKLEYQRRESLRVAEELAKTEL